MGLIIGNRIRIESRSVEGTPGFCGRGGGTHWNHFCGDAALSFERELQSWLACLLESEVFAEGHVG